MPSGPGDLVDVSWLVLLMTIIPLGPSNSLCYHHCLARGRLDSKI